MGDSGWNLSHELIKAVLSASGGILVLVLGWFIGQKLTYTWNVRQKRREMQLSASQQFYIAYGEFFAVWKLWNRLDQTKDNFEERKWELLKRAAAAEATVEGTLVKLCSELSLDTNQIVVVGCFRQAFQQLREHIQRGKILPWYGSETPEYKRFKALAVNIAALLNSRWPDTSNSLHRSSEQLLNVTSNQWEHTWFA
jgi:hypothetical protein